MKATRADTPPADDNLTLRRERGRNAQRAFRQRQITTINELQESNHAMRVAIASLTHVASRLGNAELNDAVHNARQAAGFDDGTEWADGCDDGHAADPSTVGKQRTQALTLAGAPSSPPSGHYRTVPCGTENGRPAQHEYSAENGQQPGYLTGRMSPRLGYGLWLERPVFRVNNPPLDIVPYLEANTTLSSVIFWSGLLWGSNLLRAALDGNSEAVATAHKVFDEIVPMKSDRRVLDGIHARLMFRKQGYVTSDHPGYDPEGGMRMQDMMVRTCAANGTPLESFLRPDGVEDLLRSRLGEGYQVIELGLQGLGSSEDLSRVRRLIDMMIRSSVCLGDGPRLRFEATVQIIETWSNNWTV
ncbi:hypothetical protein FOBRF1_006923 [Fusarium oxysporum]